MQTLVLLFPNCRLPQKNLSELLALPDSSPASLRLYAATKNKPACIVVTSKDYNLSLLLPLEPLPMNSDTRLTWWSRLWKRYRTSATFGSSGVACGVENLETPCTSSTPGSVLRERLRDLLAQFPD